MGGPSIVKESLQIKIQYEERDFSHNTTLKNLGYRVGSSLGPLIKKTGLHSADTKLKKAMKKVPNQSWTSWNWMPKQTLNSDFLERGMVFDVVT